MKFKRPSTGTILGAMARFIALGGTALAARADSSRPPGSTSVTNTVTTELAPPKDYLTTGVTELSANTNGGCFDVLQMASHNAVIVRDVKVDVSDEPSPGPNDQIYIVTGTDCTGSVVAIVNPPSVGEPTLPFDPGVALAAKSGLSIRVDDSTVANVFVDGYPVPSR